MTPDSSRVFPGVLTAVALTAASLTVTACASSSNSQQAGGGSTSATISIVASTNVYSDIASQISGDSAASPNSTGGRIKVSSVITSPDTDPHSYEASPANLLALSKAEIVIENGGGYDDFMDSMLKTAHNSSASVLNAVAISGRTASAGSGLNEHVWYDFPAMEKLVVTLVDRLAALDSADKAAFAANSSAFLTRLHALEASEATISGRYSGAGVAITEPVPLYLLQACGLENRTPSAFSSAVEEGNDVSPRVLSQTLALFDQKQVKLLAYNEQTTGASTARALSAAKANSIPVVPVTETLPAGKDYLSWMASNLAAVQQALSQ